MFGVWIWGKALTPTNSSLAPLAVLGAYFKQAPKVGGLFELSRGSGSRLGLNPY